MEGASDAELDTAEAELGRRFPEAFRALYRWSNGGSDLGGMLSLERLRREGQDELSVVTSSRLMREWEWEIPDELVIFGGDGSDENYGLWLPEGGDPESAWVIQVGEIFGDPNLAVVGTRLERFLLWLSVWMFGAPETAGEPALDALGVPAELRSWEWDREDEAKYAAIAWADPDLPDPRPDPYHRGLDGDGVRALLG
jgi:hypothetical protein